jgi:hypothetical protein
VPAPARSTEEWQKLFDGQALIVAFAPEEAIAHLPQMLPTQAERERAVALAAAVLMAEPELADPKSELSRKVHELLGIDPARAAALALSLAQAVESAEVQGK